MVGVLANGTVPVPIPNGDLTDFGGIGICCKFGGLGGNSVVCVVDGNLCLRTVIVV